MIHPNAELEELTRLGEVSEPQDRPPVDPFSGSQEPYLPDPSLFEDEEKEKRLDSIAKAIITVDWKQIMEKRSVTCPYCHSGDADSHFDAAQCICKE